MYRWSWYFLVLNKMSTYLCEKKSNFAKLHWLWLIRSHQLCCKKTAAAIWIIQTILQTAFYSHSYWGPSIFQETICTFVFCNRFYVPWKRTARAKVCITYIDHNFRIFFKEFLFSRHFYVLKQIIVNALCFYLFMVKSTSKSIFPTWK